MDAAERRKRIQQLLAEAAGPVPASVLAQRLGVSRQVIVGDVALLRASGMEVTATPRGYYLSGRAGKRAIIACVHDKDGLEPELLAIVDNGCTAEDVVVEHPVYGEITGRLSLSSRYDVHQFMEKIRTVSAAPLSALTGGVHLHHLLCPDDDSLQRVRRDLAALGILYGGEKDENG